MKILYVHPKADFFSGASIFDKKLKEVFADAEHLAVETYRTPKVPFWRVAVIGGVVNLRNYDLVIYSHESIGDVVSAEGESVLIVHNYFPAFSGGSFFSRLYFRFGSRLYFNRLFEKVKKIIFLSHSDLLAAKHAHPLVASKMAICVPGAPQVDTSVLGERESTDILISGTFDWYPKRSAYKRFEKRSLMGEVVALSSYTNSYISVITDDFVVGFKLKLLELAVRCQRVISFCDLRDEVRALDIPLDFVFVTCNEEFRNARESAICKGDYSLEEKNRIIEAANRYRWQDFRLSIDAE